MHSVDPDVPSLVAVSDISQTRVTVTWSVGQTSTVNETSVYYRATDSDSWVFDAVTGTSHTVIELQPGTEYQFFVKITSYGKSSSSENVTATTGEDVARPLYFVLNLSYM